MTTPKAFRTPRLVSRENPQDARVAANDEKPYSATGKPMGHAYCPSCKATFNGARWTWERKGEDAFEHTCPACQRIHDKFPAGLIDIKGEFLKGHRAEIVAFVKAREEHDKAANPLQRIMAIEDTHGGMQVATTDSSLARGIAEALQEQFKGDLKLRYSRDENLLRATWKR
jgi:NMD protein affecting ribosome stability and mRNA decay